MIIYGIFRCPLSLTRACEPLTERMGWDGERGSNGKKAGQRRHAVQQREPPNPTPPPAQYHGFFSQLACPSAPYVRNESPTVTRPHDDDDMADLAGTDT